MVRTHEVREVALISDRQDQDRASPKRVGCDHQGSTPEPIDGDPGDRARGGGDNEL